MRLRWFRVLACLPLVTAVGVVAVGGAAARADDGPVVRSQTEMQTLFDQAVASHATELGPTASAALAQSLTSLDQAAFDAQGDPAITSGSYLLGVDDVLGRANLTVVQAVDDGLYFDLMSAAADTFDSQYDIAGIAALDDADPIAGNETVDKAPADYDADAGTPVGDTTVITGNKTTWRTASSQGSCGIRYYWYVTGKSAQNETEQGATSFLYNATAIDTQWVRNDADDDSFRHKVHFFYRADHGDTTYDDRYYPTSADNGGHTYWDTMAHKYVSPVRQHLPYMKVHVVLSLPYYPDPDCHYYMHLYTAAQIA
jgi:hypothetical protein